uniref:Uncharacterized protein n=1 Tax=Castor canadensis TaxID=51338 RepID=A0A8C0WS90_CASCN
HAGPAEGKGQEWGVRGTPRAQRRPTAVVPAQQRDPLPATRPPAGESRRRAAARHPGSRRTCPCHCGSLCPAWRQSWIASFPFRPDWSISLCLHRLATSLLS